VPDESGLHLACIEDETSITLSADESRHFLSTLDKPFTPNDRLTAAMEAAARLDKG